MSAGQPPAGKNWRYFSRNPIFYTEAKETGQPRQHFTSQPLSNVFSACAKSSAFTLPKIVAELSKNSYNVGLALAPAEHPINHVKMYSTAMLGDDDKYQEIFVHVVRK